MVLSSVIIVLWCLPLLVSDPLLSSLQVSLPALATCGITLATAIAAVALAKKPIFEWLAAISTIFLSLALILVISSTGDLSSPYLTLWMLVGLFTGLAGARTLIPAIVFVIGYGAYLTLQGLSGNEWLVFGISFVVPIIISYMLWARRAQSQEKATSAVSVLAKELNQEANKSDIIVNAIADGVIVVDTQGVIQLINPAAQTIIGWGGEDAVKLDYRSVLKIIDDKDVIVEGALDPVQQCLKTNQTVINDELGIRTVSGKALLASILASPLGKAGSGAIIVFRDITKQHAEEREQAEFISTASHEMRTPIAAIDGYLGLALNPQVSGIDDKARAYLLKAQESAGHLGRLFQNLLDISKAEDGRLAAKPSIVDMTAFVRSVIDDFRASYQEKGVELVYKPDDAGRSGQSVSPIYYVKVDSDQLREVISNLISNALKYTPEGSVTIDISGSNERVVTTVADTGIGIPAEDIPHMFQKFYRVDNSDTRTIGGTGLGLYLSRKLTESMDGRLELNSAYGQGSVFTVDLPRVSRDEAMNALSAVAATTPELDTPKV